MDTMCEYNDRLILLFYQTHPSFDSLGEIVRPLYKAPFIANGFSNDIFMLM